MPRDLEMCNEDTLDTVKLVAVSGKRRAGKTLTASFLKVVGYEEVNFADALRREVSEKYNIPLAAIFDTSIAAKNTLEPVSGKTYGQLLQYHGTERKKENEKVWLQE